MAAGSLRSEPKDSAHLSLGRRTLEAYPAGFAFPPDPRASRCLEDSRHLAAARPALWARAARITARQPRESRRRGRLFFYSLGTAVTQRNAARSGNGARSQMLSWLLSDPAPPVAACTHCDRPYSR